MMAGSGYCLVTPAKNEASFIEKTIRSVVSQTLRPDRWAIVDDGSTDGTVDVVRRYCDEHPFIVLARTGANDGRHFGSKVKAFNVGYEHLDGCRTDFLGNLDADVSFEPDYFEKLIDRFVENPKLGIAGGLIYELTGNRFRPQRISPNSVAGAVQLFRRECFEGNGGYKPLALGGIDSAAEITARARGWEVRTFEDLKVLHHRPVQTGQGSALKRKFRHGITHYMLGYSMLFETVRCLLRLNERPLIVGRLSMICGYFWGRLRRYERALPDDVVRFFQAEQRRRIARIIVPRK